MSFILLGIWYYFLWNMLAHYRMNFFSESFHFLFFSLSLSFESVYRGNHCFSSVFVSEILFRNSFSKMMMTMKKNKVCFFCAREKKHIHRMMIDQLFDFIFGFNNNNNRTWQKSRRNLSSQSWMFFFPVFFVLFFSSL